MKQGNESKGVLIREPFENRKLEHQPLEPRNKNAKPSQIFSPGRYEYYSPLPLSKHTRIQERLFLYLLIANYISPTTIFLLWENLNTHLSLKAKS